MPIPVIIAAVAAAASVAQAGVGISKQDKQRYMTEQLSFLSAEEQRKLEKRLNEAKTEQERISIISGAVSTVAEARLKGMTTVQLEREKTRKTILVLGVVGGVLILLTVLITTKRN